MQEMIPGHLPTSRIPEHEELLRAASSHFSAAYGVSYLFATRELTETSEVQIYPGSSWEKPARKELKEQLKAGRVVVAMLVLSSPSKGKNHASIRLSPYIPSELRPRAQAIAMEFAQSYGSVNFHA